MLALQGEQFINFSFLKCLALGNASIKFRKTYIRIYDLIFIAKKHGDDPQNQQNSPFKFC